MFKKSFLIYFFVSAVAMNMLPLLSFANPNENDSQIFEQLDNEYLFQTGDGLLIRTFPDTNSFLNRLFPIDDKGYVDFPIIGRVNIVGMTKIEIINFIKKNFKQHIRSTSISIKPMCRISILGGVIEPGLYYLDYNTTFWGAIQRVGGTTHENGLKNMRWERNRKEISDNLIPYFEKGITLKNMGFQSGDQISTPSTHITFWDRFRSDFLPILTFGTTVLFFYLTYQQQAYILQSIH